MLQKTGLAHSLRGDIPARTFLNLTTGRAGFGR
jgi:hypothetical protein